MINSASDLQGILCSALCAGTGDPPPWAVSQGGSEGCWAGSWWNWGRAEPCWPLVPAALMSVALVLGLLTRAGEVRAALLSLPTTQAQSCAPALWRAAFCASAAC